MTNNLCQLKKKEKKISRRNFLQFGSFITSIGLLQFFNLKTAQAFGVFGFLKQGAAVAPYVDDVFSIDTYTGTGATQTITNGIDLAGKGGLIWIKTRSPASFTSHTLWDSARLGSSSQPFGAYISADTTAAQQTYPANSNHPIPSSSGFSLDSASFRNNSGESYVSWTFRKSAKFFDVVTYTGNATDPRSIPHNLGVAPGMIIIKNLDVGTANAIGDWAVWHRSKSPALTMCLNSNTADTGTYYIGTTNHTSTTFEVKNAYTNQNTNKYVAYLFAHDTSANSIIQCGSYTGNGLAQKDVTIGFEPQFLFLKRVDSTSEWHLFDTSRGMSSLMSSALFANTSSSDTIDTGTTSVQFVPTATGFSILYQTSGGGLVQLNGNGASYIYMAIRRPNKAPTSGTQVYNAVAYTASNGNTITPNLNFDLLIGKQRNTGYLTNTFVVDTLRGIRSHLSMEQNIAEKTNSHLIESKSMTGYTAGMSGDDVYGLSSNGTTYINWFFKRAPGVFDIVAYSMITQTATILNHALTVIPELIIIKQRTTNVTAQNWAVYASPSQRLRLNTTDQVYGGETSV